MVELQQCGYPVSFNKADFVGRYRWVVAYSQPALLDEATHGLDSVCVHLLREARVLLGPIAGSDDGEAWGAEDYQLGRTKVGWKELLASLRAPCVVPRMC